MEFKPVTKIILLRDPSGCFSVETWRGNRIDVPTFWRTLAEAKDHAHSLAALFGVAITEKVA